MSEIENRGEVIFSFHHLCNTPEIHAKSWFLFAYAIKLIEFFHRKF